MLKRMDVAVYQQSKDGNAHCGDSYFFKETKDEFICVIADGLGSGVYAKESSLLVIDIIQNNSSKSIEELGELCNAALIGKRGVVVGILKIHFPSQKYTYSSIGNIGFLTVREGNEKKRTIPRSGYLAGHKQPFKVNEGELQQNMNFIMFSDGLEEKELAENYFMHHDVHTITKEYKHRINGIAKDDTTLIAMRYTED